jgi:signal peptide peptidase SppA
MNEHIFGVDRAKARELRAFLRLDQGSIDKIVARAATRTDPPTASRDSGGIIAIMPVFGFIEQRPSIFGDVCGGTSTEKLTAQYREANADPQVKAVLLNVASGGGSVFGVTEFVSEVLATRGAKPIVAIVNSMAASAAYWIASCAHEIVSVPSGITGSIGVYAIHQDQSEADKQAGIKTEIISAGEHKAYAVDGSPLSDEGRAAMQEMVDHFYSLFVSDIAAGRGVSVAKVKADFGKGLTMTAPAAKAAGLIDRIGTLDETLKRLSTPQGRAAVMRAEYVEPVADDGEAQRRILMARATV